jgi:hypothetical protein
MQVPLFASSLNNSEWTIGRSKNSDGPAVKTKLDPTGMAVVRLLAYPPLPGRV